MIAVGLGCRAGCGVDQVLEMIEETLAASGCCLQDIRALYTAEFKFGEAGLRQAAERLSKPLVLLPLAQLQAQADRTLTRSVQTLERFGVPSVAETAALAGAVQLEGGGALARLLGPRRVSSSASCALASAAHVTEPAR